ncbi:hypothetical protein DFJ74DRAFT_680019 [Hyaloraphidium curvatum]|nr:hypothetical protein DFJ74DRAFT_680019 [Hyaloraphidium curvatum]
MVRNVRQEPLHGVGPHAEDVLVDDDPQVGVRVAEPTLDAQARRGHAADALERDIGGSTDLHVQCLANDCRHESQLELVKAVVAQILPLHVEEEEVPASRVRHDNNLYADRDGLVAVPGGHGSQIDAPVRRVERVDVGGHVVDEGGLAAARRALDRDQLEAHAGGQALQEQPTLRRQDQPAAVCRADELQGLADAHVLGGPAEARVGGHGGCGLLSARWQGAVCERRLLVENLEGRIASRPFAVVRPC